MRVVVGVARLGFVVLSIGSRCIWLTLGFDLSFDTFISFVSHLTKLLNVLKLNKYFITNETNFWQSVLCNEWSQKSGLTKTIVISGHICMRFIAKNYISIKFLPISRSLEQQTNDLVKRSNSDIHLLSRLSQTQNPDQTVRTHRYRQSINSSGIQRERQQSCEKLRSDFLEVLNKLQETQRTATHAIKTNPLKQKSVSTVRSIANILHIKT